MEREWVVNSQPPRTEILGMALLTIGVLAIIPVSIFLALISRGNFEALSVCCCTSSVITLIVLSSLCYSAINKTYKAVTHVGFSAEGIALRHRASDTLVLKWSHIDKIEPALSPGESNLNYWHPETLVKTFEVIDKNIAEMITLKMSNIQIPEDRRYCPGCGRKNDGWAYCPGCGTGWNA